jgi:polygalacturonase
MKLVLYLAACSFLLRAQDTRTVTEPSFPPVCAQLAAKLIAGPAGLAPESETLLDTQAIQGALDTCPAGQAVRLRSHHQAAAFLTGPLKIPAGVTLLIDPDVMLYASRNPRDYDATAAKTCGTLQTASGGCLPIITVNRANGSGIMGYGVIDGRGYLPMLGVSMSWWELARSAAGNLTQNNPRMLQVSNTDGFTLYKVTLKNSPNFHVALGSDTNVTIWGVKIIAPYDARNTDGIDPGYSSNVTITNSYISEGDDNVAVGGSNSPGAKNISVVNNWFGNGHGASIGSYTEAGVSNVLFQNITIAGDAADRNQTGLRIKSDVSRGGLVQNITYRNICMKDVRSAIELDPFYTAGATGTLAPRFSNIVMNNVHATTEGSVKIQGHDAATPTTITLNNVQIDGIKPADLSLQYAGVTLGPDPVNFSAMLKGTGVTVTDQVSQSDPAYACPASFFAPIAGELFNVRPGRADVQVFTTKEVPYATYQAGASATLDLPAPTGTVTIYDAGAAIGSAQLNGARVLSIHLGTLSVGKHALTAAYSGDPNYPAFAFGSYSVEIASPRPLR